MAAPDKPSTRETRRLQTRERLLGAAIAEFKRAGMAAADVGSIAKQFAQFVKPGRDLQAVLREAVRLVLGLERRLGDLLFKEFLALHFSQTRPPAEGVADHALVVLLADQIEAQRERGDIDPDVNPVNSSVFFLLGFYALLITTNDWPTRDALLEDYVARTVRSMALPG